MKNKAFKRSAIVAKTAQHSVQRAPDLRQSTPEPWWWDSPHALRAVRQFGWLEVGSVKAALSRPSHCS